MLSVLKGLFKLIESVEYRYIGNLKIYIYWVFFKFKYFGFFEN